MTSTVIDVGGDVYDLEAGKNVDLSHKSRSTFLQTFNKHTYNELPVEYLLRKYLPVGQKIDNIVFDPPGDYDKLMDILKRRVRQLQASEQFSSQIVRNITIRRIHARILEIIEELRRKKTVKKTMELPKLSDNDIFQLILEMSWYLAHPTEAPAKMAKEWELVIEELQEQRVSDILQAIRVVEGSKGIPPSNPLQYFKKLDMSEVTDAKTLGEAMGRVRNMATSKLVNAEPIQQEMKDRLRNLTRVLSLKGYVDGKTPKNSNGIPIINTNKLDLALLENPMANTGENEEGEEKGDRDEKKSDKEKTGGGRKKAKTRASFTGGAVSELSVPLGQAMLPIFRYLQVLFDPVYSMLEQATASSVKKGILPHLLLLLHLCNEFTIPVKKMEFGLYHLKNIPAPLYDFLAQQMDETIDHLAEMKSDEERGVFQQQLFHLPSVRLRSLIRNNGGIPTMNDKRQTIYHLQFFIVGRNLMIPDEAAFKAKNPNVDSKVLDAMRKALVPDSVFLAYTDAGTTTKDIPFRFFEVDYESIDINQPGIQAKPLSPELDTLLEKGMIQESNAYVDQLATIKPHVTYNHAELALSVLMCLKERMPK